MNRTFCILAVTVWCFGFAAAAPLRAEGPGEFRERLNEMVAIALEQNPKLQEAQKRIEANREITPQVGSLDDPILQFGLMSLPMDTFAFDEWDMTQKLITLSQKFPFPGKLGLREDIAEKNVHVTEQAYEALRLDVKRRVKESFFELCFILSAIETTRENKTLLEQFVTITETKYSVGKGLQQDVLKAQVELTKIMDELIRLDRRRETEQARLNTLMNRLPQAPLSIPHGLRRTELSLSLEGLQEQALAHNPSLKGLQILKERFQIAEALAKRQYYPDFNIGVRYGQRDDGLVKERPDFVSAFVGVNIPIWHKTKQSRKVAEERVHIAQVQESYFDRRNQIYLKIKELMDEQRRTSETLELIGQGILPQARQSLEAALTGYSVDKVDFLTLLDNQVTLFKWEIKYHEELARHEKVLAALEQVVGVDLFQNNPTH